MSGATAVLKPGEPVTLPPAGNISFEIEKGQRFKMTQPEGEQVADLISFNRDDRREILSMLTSRAVNLSYKFTAPMTLYSNLSREMWKIDEDLELLWRRLLLRAHEHAALRRQGEGRAELPGQSGEGDPRLRHGPVEFQRRCLLQHVHDGDL